jgi:hypothetical protein
MYTSTLDLAASPSLSPLDEAPFGFAQGTQGTARTLRARYPIIRVTR